MGANRVIPASASAPSIMMQTHSSSGSRSSPIPALDASCSIKIEPSVLMDLVMPSNCLLENWEESYQDLSSWCSATSASSPAICQSPATDETASTELDFQGEIDFDLRKSEEIASVPLEEDCSINLWGLGSPLLSDSASPSPSVPAVTSTDSSEPVLLNDCWWFDSESVKGGKRRKSIRSQTVTSNPSIKTHLVDDIPSPSAAVEEGAIKPEENMIPIPVSHPLLSDPDKMAELQLRLEKIASHTHPGVNSKSKAADLMKILQEQILESNRKKYRSPAAISDLHNHHSPVQEQGAGNANVMESKPYHTQTAVISAPTLSGSDNDIFRSDPFEALFYPSIAQPALEEQQSILPTTNVSQSQVLNQQVVAPAFISNNFQPLNSAGATIPSHIGAGSDALPRSDLFSQVHHEIIKEETIKEVLKPQYAQLQPQYVNNASQPLQSSSGLQQDTVQSTWASIQAPANRHPTPSITVKNENGLTLQLPASRVNMPELDLNFDALLFGTSGSSQNFSKTPAISTPEVLKPLVETPDPESFDLLSYLFDDKLSTPPVFLGNNPFQFPQPNSSRSTSTTAAVTEVKPNVMVVRPLASERSKDMGGKLESGKSNESAVVVEVKPQIMPSGLSDVEEVKEECSDVDLKKPVTEEIKEELVSPRPSRSPRKRKYSDEFVFSPSPCEDSTSTKSSRRRRTTSSKYDSDEDFTPPVRKSRKRSVAPIIEDDEDQVVKKRSKVPATERRRERRVSTSSESDRYRELRDRNNEASRKSRLTRKAREQELGQQAEVLTRENRILKVKVDEMESLVKKLREALLQSMLKKP